MADDDKKIIYILDLETGTFEKKLGDAQKQTDKLGASKGPKELIENFKGLAATALKVYAAFKTVEVALDAAMEGEKVLKIEKNFETLAKTAGIAGEQLKEGLKSASGGLIDDTDLLKAANEAIVVLGKDASRLPQIMEVARKASTLMGTDLKATFEDMSFAVQTGNARLLKQYGIVLDNEKALKDYAKAKGKVVAALSEEEERQARLNAFLSKGTEQYKDVAVSNATLSASWEKMKVAVSQAAEGLQLLVYKVLGPVFKAAFEKGAEVVGLFSRTMRSLAGEESESDRISANIEQTEKRISSFSKEVQRVQGLIDRGLAVDRNTEDLKKYTAALTAEQKKLEDLKIKQVGVTGKDKSTDDLGAKGDQDKQLKLQAAFEKDLVNLRMKTIDERIKLATTEGEVEAQYKNKAYEIDQQLAQQKLDLQAKVAAGEMTGSQAQQQIMQLEEQNHLRKMQLIEEEKQAREAALENYLNKSENTFDGIGRAAEVSSIRAAKQMNDFGATGRRVMDSFEKRSVSAFVALGEGSKSASDIAKGFILGMLADEAEARGRLMMLASIFPFNPAGFAGGAALLALSGYLRAQSGGGGGGGASGGGEGGGYVGGGTINQDAGAKVEQNQAKKAVSINIQGSYYETEQTRTRLMELIRESSDATDFTLKQIGQA